MRDNVKIELDKYELGTIINALSELRNKTIKEERETTPINELLEKLVKVYEKSNFYKMIEAR